MFFNGFQVTIADGFNGQLLPEHQAKIVGNTIECYLECRVNSRFTINLMDCRPLRPGVVCTSFIDGSTVDSMITDHYSHPQKVIQGLRDSSTSIRPFYFTKPVVVDDEHVGVLKDQNVIQSLGTIRIALFRVTPLYPVTITTGYQDQLSDRKLAEKPAKLLQSVTTLGPPEFVHPMNMQTAATHVHYIDPFPTHPWFQFVFKYMPRDMLEAKVIIPSIVKPEPIASIPAATTKRRREDDEISLLRAENNKLKKKVKTQRQQLARVTASSSGKLEELVINGVPCQRDAKGRIVIELD